MTRRVLLAALCASAGRADAGDDAWTLLGEVAAALSAAEWARLIDCFDPAMAGYEDFRADAGALLREASPRSSIELISNKGDDRTRTIVVDWTLAIAQVEGAAAPTRRQSRVTLKMAKQGKRWRITGFDPVRFFAPPRA